MTFIELRTLLRRIRDDFGPCFSVSASLVGDTLTVSIARPETGLRPYALTFDDEADYSLDRDKLIADFIGHARAYFGTAPT